MPSVYGYARVSTLAQADDGESLGVQQRQVEGWCHMQGTTLASVFVERGVSGSILLSDRPEGARMLGALARGDTVVAAKLDRLFRSALDALQMVEALRQRGVHLVLLDLGGDIASNGMGKLFLTIAAAFAEAERDRIRERIATVKRDQRDRGRYLGGKVPFGYRIGDGGALLPVDAEQAAIRSIRAMREAGKPLRAIRAALATDGLSLSLDAIQRIAGPAPAA